MPDYFDVPRIAYEGPDTDNPLAFRHYNPDEVVGEKPMREHLRFACAYWHTMRNVLADPFGVGTAQMPWDDGSGTVGNAKKRVKVFFEFLRKCQIDYYCFHDRDIAPEGKTLAQSNKNLDSVVAEFKRQQERTGKKLLWGTACLFTHPRYNQGAATSPYLDVFTYAAAQVKKALEVTHELGGEGYVFWGGREGYSTLLNTDMKRELDHLAAFLHMAVEHARRIGFTGQFYIEPKPQEPTTHQYDSDAAACLNFLREYDLLDHFKLNLETNHATLAGHTMLHEMLVAATAGALGSVDANSGTPNCGWDTDQFPTDIYQATYIMLVVLKMGGFTTGGLNFDAKRRRESFEPVDLFHAHIGGMDTLARGLKIAHRIMDDHRICDFISQRYKSWETELGMKIETGHITLADLEKIALSQKEPVTPSGRQEMLENMINDYL
ncbi:MAG: xylose isomerase [Verrucomicrobiota bacterium JB024]|nr:xylose isomerase [Verrucomicrobiota bacterium JB024]